MDFNHEAVSQFKIIPGCARRQKADPCEDHMCLNNGKCRPVDDVNYKCECQHGYSGPMCDIGKNCATEEMARRAVSVSCLVPCFRCTHYLVLRGPIVDLLPMVSSQARVSAHGSRDPGDPAWGSMSWTPFMWWRNDTRSQSQLLHFVYQCPLQRVNINEVLKTWPTFLESQGMLGGCQPIMLPLCVQWLGEK